MSFSRRWLAGYLSSRMTPERLRWIVGDDEFLVDTEYQNALIFAIECAANAPRERRPDRAARASHFSWAEVGKMYRDFLKEVVDGYKR